MKRRCQHHPLRIWAVVCILLPFVLSSCVPVHQNIQPRVVTPANQYQHSQTQTGVSVAALPYAYSGTGLDYTRAGIYPLRVTVTNQTSRAVTVSPESVLLLGGDGNLYMTYTPYEATQLVINSHSIQEAAKGAATGAVAGAALGALVGLTIGHIFKIDPGRMAAAGAVHGGVRGAAGGSVGYLVQLRNAASNEMESNALRQTAVAPGMTASGWLFFPGHVMPKELRIAISEIGTGSFRTFIFYVM